MRRRAWMIAAFAALVGCSSNSTGASTVRVAREGRADQVFGAVHLECELTPLDSTPGGLLHCLHGDPDESGIELTAIVSASIEDLTPGSALEQGADLQVSAIAGAQGGAIWGASGDSSWWEGDLAIVLEEGDEGGQPATFDGTMETTSVAAATGLAPITIEFTGTTATLP